MWYSFNGYAECPEYLILVVTNNMYQFVQLYMFSFIIILG